MPIGMTTAERVLEEVRKLSAKVGVGDIRDGEVDKESLNKRLGRLEGKVHKLVEMLEGGGQKDDFR